ncbi:class I adenylate-forming enzyme family protein [Piscinibacter sp.]|uniref:class I adenylate-forming enzyme family protein n=1 Tax=Piscinibacter sp. TaxID=1903157 RepID=UPI002CB9631F|nr:long-chain-fatty-acid--CoA ligase [Albitalea sp.]HUG21001.1 long-chain-fatty-acid--CoA ligase [Albitalea sp.]
MYLTQGLHRALQQRPEVAATVFGRRRTTFGALTGRVARLAGAFARLGLSKGDRIAMLALNSDRYVEALLAAWWLGAVACPLNTRWSIPEIVDALNDCGARTLVVDDACVPVVAELRPGTPALERVVHAGEQPAPEGTLDWEALLAGAEPLEDARPAGDTLAAILYTGGTTGAPKGVMLSHANFWVSAVARMAEVPSPANGVSLLVAPLFHVAGLGRVVSQVINGSTSVLLPVFRAETVLATLQNEGITDVMLVPSMLQMLLDHPAFPDADLRHLERIIHGASPISPGLLERAMKALPHCGFQSVYGMTETAATACSNGPFVWREGVPLGSRELAAGRPCFGNEVRIVDAEGREVPRNAVGEITLRGANVMQGYWNKPEETRAALRDGWLYTGDGGCMDDAGRVHVVDRVKDMIISGGENVYSAEVEAVLSRHAAVAACAAIGIPSAAWGEAVHAVVVLRPGASATEEALRAHCRASLAGYKCPKTIEFQDALPLSPAGKVLKTVLREPFWGAGARQVN